MKRKTRLIGIVAAVALSLSMATGVMAQGDTTATLNNNATDGNCFAIISEATFDLGVWEWDGSQYVLEGALGTNNVASGNIDVTQTVSSENVNCNVAALVSDLTNGGTGTIAAGLLTAVLNPLSQPISTSTGAGEDVALTVTLNGVGTPPQGLYTGDVTVTASVAGV